jgi:hypothetical protein
VRVRIAMAWRIRWLCAYAMSASKAMAYRDARIGHSTADYHLNNDPDFAAQADSAREYAIDLLHTRSMQRCIEGDIEPVYWQGEIVGYIRKFDSRLQIEMLRAYRPDRFKTPGTGPTIDARGSVFVLTEKDRHRLQEIHKIMIAEEEEKARTAPGADLGANDLRNASEPPALRWTGVDTIIEPAKDQRNAEG